MHERFQHIHIYNLNSVSEYVYIKIFILMQNRFSLFRIHEHLRSYYIFKQKLVTWNGLD